MVAVSDTAAMEDNLAGAIDAARNHLSIAIAKAHLTDDPLGVALEAMSQSLGAQLALHKASLGFFHDIRTDLDGARRQAVEHGKLELEAGRAAIVSQLAPELVKLTASRVKREENTAKLKTIVVSAGLAVALSFTTMIVGYGMGWKAGQVSGLYDKGALGAVLQEFGPETEASLIKLVRNNNIPAVLATCEAHSGVQNGRKACAAPLWLDPPPPAASPANKGEK